MKVLLLSTSDLDGGAARAAYRLHQGLKANGATSQMLVQKKVAEDEDVLEPQGKLGKGISSLRPTLDMLPLYITRQVHPAFSTAWVPDRIAERAAELNPDVISVQWVNKGFMQIESLRRLRKPVVWTLHDMWAFTGGCHYDRGCGRYVERCGCCPQLDGRREGDLSRWIWRRKAKAWKEVPFTIVCPSRWMAACASKSSLFAGRRIEVIANGLDLSRYRPVEHEQARCWLGLPPNKRLILFSAVKGIHNPQKGFPYLVEALWRFSELGWRDQAEVVVLGSTSPDQPVELPFKAHYLGHLQDDISLALVYGAADLFVAPSLQDNLPNTVMEAMACGTPAAAFNVGGMPDLIDHQVNGYLAPYGDSEALAIGMDWILRDMERWNGLARKARAKVEVHFDQVQQAKRYLDLFEELLQAGRL